MNFSLLATASSSFRYSMETTTSAAERGAANSSGVRT